MRRTLRRVGAWIDRHASVLALAAALAVGVGSILGVRAEARIRAESDAEQPEQICEAFRLQQRITMALIDAVLEPGAGELPLLSPESFSELPESVQAYLYELVNLTPDTGSSLAERLARFRESYLGPDHLPAYCLTDARG